LELEREFHLRIAEEKDSTKAEDQPFIGDGCRTNQKVFNGAS
jgi:murein endopeptidase